MLPLSNAAPPDSKVAAQSVVGSETGAGKPARINAQPLLAMLAARYPNTFFQYQYCRRPLAIGIHAELTQALVPTLMSQEELAAALRSYTVNLGYQRALRVVGTTRLDLEGLPAGTVTLEQAQIATEKYTTLLAKVKAATAARRTAAKRAAQAARGLASLADLKAAAARRKAAMAAEAAVVETLIDETPVVEVSAPKPAAAKPARPRRALKPTPTTKPRKAAKR